MGLGAKLRQVRLQRGLTQDQISKVLKYDTNSYVSDVEIGKFIPQPDKLDKWAEALGMTDEEMNDLVLEDKLEQLGMNDPAFTMMFKDVPQLDAEEKQSIIRAYQAVMRARAQKGKRK